MRRLFNLLLVPVSLTLILAGIVITCCGIGLEVLTGEPFYLVIITIGSCLVAGGIIFHTCCKKKSYWK